MAGHRYATKDFETEHMARAVGTDLPISTKFSVEICNWIRKKNLQKAKVMLSEVIEKKRAVPFKRFNWDLGHKKTTPAAGRYPVKAASAILKLLESVEANAQFKGLNTQNLIINHLVANKASTQMRYGRHRGRETKSTHVEIIVKESTEKKAPKKEKAEPVKKEAKKEEKKEPEAKEEKPKEEAKKEKTGAKKEKSKSEDKK